MIRIEKNREGGMEEEETILFIIITQESLYFSKGAFNNYKHSKQCSKLKSTFLRGCEFWNRKIHNTHTCKTLVLKTSTWNIKLVLLISLSKGNISTTYSSPNKVKFRYTYQYAIPITNRYFKLESHILFTIPDLNNRFHVSHTHRFLSLGLSELFRQFF